MASLDPQWVGGRPRQIGTDDEQFIVATAKARPETLGRPFTRWSIRKLADYLSSQPARSIEIGRERLRQVLHRDGITFQRTKTWKESTDPDRDPELARIEYVSSHMPQRVFAFDEFGPLAIRPAAVPAGRPPGIPTGSRRTITSCTGCGSSTAATASATTSSGVLSGAAKALGTLSPHSRPFAGRGRTGRRSTSSRRPGPRAAGPGGAAARPATGP